MKELYDTVAPAIYRCVNPTNQLLCKIQIRELLLLFYPNFCVFFFQDLSRNGTFVNSERIGTNRRRILQNDDIISLSHPTYKGS